MMSDSPAPYRYRGYGLGIHSTLPLPELLADATSEPDVVVRQGRVAAPAEMEDGKACLFPSPDLAFVHLPLVGGTCVVRGGREVIVDPMPGVEARVVRLLVLGPALALVVVQRGLFPLHGSVVVVGGRAIGFVGPSGCGKSTIAAAFHGSGYSLIDDDLLVVDGTSAELRVIPGFPRLKLWEDAATQIVGTVEQLPRIRPEIPKLAWIVDRRFQTTPLPLGAVYVLNDSDRLGIEPLDPQAAFGEVIGNSYGVQSLHRMWGVAHFPVAVRVASQVPIRRLSRPRSLSALPLVVAAVIDDLSRTAVVR